MNNHASLAQAGRTGLVAISCTGDLVMTLTMVGNAAAALAIGSYFGSLPLALGICGLLLAVGASSFLFARGTRFSQLTLTACNVAFVALHIQLGRGTIEFHFGVFVLLGLTLVYCDWKPLLWGALLFAAHHVVFDRLQALGYGVYCAPEANLLKTVMHAAYVVAQTSVEVYLSTVLRCAAIEASELSGIVQTVDRGEVLCLDVSAVPTSTPMASMMKAVILKISSAMSDVNDASASVEVAASEIAHGNLDLSRRTELQAGSLQQTSASMEELVGTVGNSANTAATANELAQKASVVAEEGGRVVGEVVATMKKISNSSDEITEIIGVINSIAFQTNILALNAAVEAARAGEHGRGFAVVASEVRGLAQRSADAAKEIKALIDASAAHVSQGASLVERAGSDMHRIVDQARRVSQLIGEITVSTDQQTSGIAQIGDAVGQLDVVTQQNAALVEQGAAASESLRHQAIRLNAVVQRFALAPA